MRLRKKEGNKDKLGKKWRRKRIINYFLVFIFILILSTLLYFGLKSGITGATTINAASCSRADVNFAITTAVDGDRVLIPSCAPTTWTSGISISNKGITIEGAGIGATTIVNGASGALLFEVYLQAGDPVFTETNFE